jgi:hypothetical protein
VDLMPTVNTQFGQERHLLTRDEVAALLQLDDASLQELINTRQLIAIRICGQERFDSADVYALVESYKRTQSRRIN